MSDLSQAIAANIAGRRREISLAERGFLLANAAADTVGLCRRALARLAVKAADGIGVVRLRMMKAAPKLGADLANRLAETRQARTEAEAAQPVQIPAPVRRRWEAALKRLGRYQVREALDRTMHLPETAPFMDADTGLTHGATRYPSRGFVVDWAADSPEDDGGIWRVLTICAIFAMIGAGLLFLSVL